MKNPLLVLAAPIVTILAGGFLLLQTHTVKRLEQVGIPAELIRDCIWSSFSGGYLSYPNVWDLRKISAAERAVAVREIAEFARRYTRSEEFKKKYLEYRENQKPAVPEPPPTAAERRKADKEAMKKNLREMEANMKSAAPEQRAIFQQTIEMMKQQLKEMDNPDNPMYSPQIDEMNKQVYQAQMDEYRKQLAEWERDYPPAPDKLIKRWLTQFLEESRDVDYDAKLTEGEYGTKVFANPLYERKSPHWKMCYRAGREVVLAGRAEAERWLRELK